MRAAGLILLPLLLAACGQPVAAGQAAAAHAAPGASPRPTTPNMAVSAPTVKPAQLDTSGPPAPPAASPSSGSPPVRLRIPSIGVDTSLGRLGLNSDGTIEVPADWDQAGWYAKGPAPGEVGPAVVLGHLDSYTGPAVFARLASLKPGAEVLISSQDGTQLRFVVDRLASFSSDSFPTDQVYGVTPGPELRLITCGGTFNVGRGRYSANVVAFATLTGAA
jgi:sortase (surface protein transpeptidase)